MNKRFLCFVITLCMLLSMGNGSVFANDGSLPISVENAVEAQFIGEENGIRKYEATIPIVWVSSDGNSDNQTRNASNCTCYINYYGNGVWTYGLTFSGMDLIKSLSGNVTTTGVAGTTSRDLEAYNLVPASLISVNEELHFLHPLESGYQYFTVSGTVVGVRGYGTFGPQTNSYYVTVE